MADFCSGGVLHHLDERVFMEIFGVPLPALMSQLLLGLVNGSFYAMLSLGLAVIFGLLNVINFAHGALYMLGAFLAWMGLSTRPQLLGHADPGAAAGGPVRHRHRATMLRWLYKLDHLYGLLLTFGITLLVEGVFRSFYGVSGQPFRCRSCCRRDQPRLHGAAELPRLGGGGLAGGVLRHLVRDREDRWAPTCAPAPRTPSW
jgi:branched-subunit amino acid ABC-type transport system permease component